MIFLWILIIFYVISMTFTATFQLKPMLGLLKMVWKITEFYCTHSRQFLLIHSIQKISHKKIIFHLCFVLISESYRRRISTNSSPHGLKPGNPVRQTRAISSRISGNPEFRGEDSLLHVPVRIRR